jgi:hypothetical protein
MCPAACLTWLLGGLQVPQGAAPPEATSEAGLSGPASPTNSQATLQVDNKAGAEEVELVLAVVPSGDAGALGTTLVMSYANACRACT